MTNLRHVLLRIPLLLLLPARSSRCPFSPSCSACPTTRDCSFLPVLPALGLHVAPPFPQALFSLLRILQEACSGSGTSIRHPFPSLDDRERIVLMTRRRKQAERGGRVCFGPGAGDLKRATAQRTRDPYTTVSFRPAELSHATQCPCLLRCPFFPARCGVATTSTGSTTQRRASGFKTRLSVGSRRHNKH